MCVGCASCVAMVCVCSSDDAVYFICNMLWPHHFHVDVCIFPQKIGNVAGQKLRKMRRIKLREVINAPGQEGESLYTLYTC
jgi:hypothetical protein